MEDGDDAPKSFFPGPPPFYKDFTAANLERLKAIKEEAKAARQLDGPDDDVTLLQSLDVPAELKNLVPPEPPADGTYRTFGEIWDLNEHLPALKEMGVEQLFPDPPEDEVGDSKSGWTLDRAFMLNKLAKSILVNFLELVGVLSVNPTEYVAKIDDFSTLFLNAHHLINDYRPHEARETLIHMMEDQLEQKRAEIKGVKRMKEKIRNLMAELKSQGADARGRKATAPDVLGTAGNTSKPQVPNPFQVLDEELDT